MNRTVWIIFFALSLLAIAVGLWWPREYPAGIPCFFLASTGYPCPFCGMTRAFLAAGHGAWREALQQSPVGALLFPGAIVVAVVSGWRSIRRASGAQQSDPRIPRWVWMGAALMLAANWVYRLLTGLK